MKILDMGCGKRKHPDSIGLDKHRFDGVDVVWDLENIPLPFKTNGFDVIIADNILEHLDISFPALLEELHRTLKPGGVLKIKVPHFSNPDAFIPTHKKYFCYDSFNLSPESHSLTYSNLWNKFKVIKKRLMFGSLKFIEPIVNRFPRIWEKWLRYPPAIWVYFEVRKGE